MLDLRKLFGIKKKKLEIGCGLCSLNTELFEDNICFRCKRDITIKENIENTLMDNDLSFHDWLVKYAYWKELPDSIKDNLEKEYFMNSAPIFPPCRIKCEWFGETEESKRVSKRFEIDHFLWSKYFNLEKAPLIK